ncbi:MAG TPA: DUF2255 family protein [Candidatus Limnocylindrales bacterium]
MQGWTSEELSKIDRAEELELESQRSDGSLGDPVTIWVVRDGEDLYVRSMHGRAGSWFRGAQSSHRGHIRSGGIEKDVTFVEDTDTGLSKRLDAAYRSKYKRYSDGAVGGVVNPASRKATLKLVPV